MDGELPPEANEQSQRQIQVQKPVHKKRCFTKDRLTVIRAYCRQRRWKHIVHWVIVAGLIAGGIYIGNLLTEKNYWINARYNVYQFLMTRIPRPVRARRTALVVIGDDEYWKGELSARVPIKRDYLGKIVDALREANAAVIALDFDLRSPSPVGDPVEFPDYVGETGKFLDAVKFASQHRKIILPRTVVYDNQHNYISRSDIYDKFNFESDNVRTGYIALPPDSRQVPWLSLQIKNGEPLNSFSQAIARADNDRALQSLPERLPLPFCSYMRTEEFVSVPASDVLRRAADAFEKVAYKVVIVGGVWHRLGYGEGPYIDEDVTPIGIIPGAYIHANYVEALLDSRTYRPYEGWILIAIEILESLLVAIPFALAIRLLYKTLIVVLCCLGLIGFSLFSLLVLGLFFDFFIPVILVIGHGFVEHRVSRRQTNSKANAKGE